jgi:hypothetical protein
MLNMLFVLKTGPAAELSVRAILLSSDELGYCYNWLYERPLVLTAKM